MAVPSPRVPTQNDRATVVFQEGRPAAEVFRDPTSPEIEHWVLFTNFVLGSEVQMMWISGAKTYTGGLNEFMRHAAKKPGARYMQLDRRTGEWVPVEP